MSINLKNATQEDFDFIWSLYSQSVSLLMDKKLENGWNDEDEKKKFMTIFSEEDTKLIYESGVRVGWVDYRIQGDELHLINGYVIPEKRRQGIGQAVIEQLAKPNDERMVKSGNFKIIKASTVSDSPFNGFFEKLGFKTASKDENFTNVELI